MREKFKSWLANDHIFYGAIVIIFGTGSFFLGQQSVGSTEANSPTVKVVEPVVIEKTVSTPTTVADKTETTSPDNVKMTLVGSKNGTKYHLPTCPGAKQIKPENLVQFASAATAEAAGYTKAGNCPGL